MIITLKSIMENECLFNYKILTASTKKYQDKIFDTNLNYILYTLETMYQKFQVMFLMFPLKVLTHHHFHYTIIEKRCILSNNINGIIGHIFIAGSNVSL